MGGGSFLVFSCQLRAIDIRLQLCNLWVMPSSLVATDGCGCEIGGLYIIFSPVSPTRCVADVLCAPAIFLPSVPIKRVGGGVHRANKEPAG